MLPETAGHHEPSPFDALADDHAHAAHGHDEASHGTETGHGHGDDHAAHGPNDGSPLRVDAFVLLGFSATWARDISASK